MTSDLDVTLTGEAQAGAGELDPLYQELYGDGGADAVAPRQIGFPIIPEFTHYVLKPLKATRRRSTANIGARAMVEVVAGPEGTVGHKFTDSSDVAFGFIVSRRAKNGGEIDQKTWAGKCRSRTALLNRVRQSLGLTAAVPPGTFIGVPDMPDAAVDAYAAQFETAQSFVARVQIEKGQDGVDRNRIDWGSVAGLADAATDQQGRPTGMTAHEEALAKIAAWKPKPEAGASGKSSASLGNGSLR